MKNMIFLLIILVTLSACSSNQATMRKHDKLSYEAIRAYPEWKHKKSKPQKWIAPLLCISAGAYYGYNSEFTYDGETYKGTENAAIWGGFGLLAGGILNGLLFKKRSYHSYKFDKSQSQKWLERYNRKTGGNYVLHRLEPDPIQALILVPKDRRADLLRFEEAQRDMQITRIKAEEDRIKIQQEDRRKRQETERSNEGKTKKYCPIYELGTDYSYR